MRASKRIRTVLYGDQRLSAAELEVLHTPAMQRLYSLRQLGFADRIFVDASHSRLHHVVGVLQQVDKLVSAIVLNLKRSDRVFRVGSSGETQETFLAPRLASLVRRRRPVIRLIGLLHDLTHAPFGHTVEDEIRLVETKHDEPARQADAFYRLFCQLVAWLAVEAGSKSGGVAEIPIGLRPFLSQGGDSELPDPNAVGGFTQQLLAGTTDDRANACWRLLPKDFAELLAQLRCAMTALLHSEALHDQKPTERQLPQSNEYPFQVAIRVALAGTAFEDLLERFEFQPKRDAFMLDIVGNTVCADLLDYAKRDSHFAGLRLDYDSERIAENFTLVSWDASAYEVERNGVGRVLPPGCADPFDGWCLRTAISLVSHKYRTDVPGELMNLLNVRFYLYERAIYHPTKCAAGSMLGTALQLMGWRGDSDDGDRPTLPPHLRFVGDEVFLHDVRAALAFLESWSGAQDPARSIESRDIEAVAHLDSVHSGLVPKLLALRIGHTARQAHEEFTAARLLLDRLGARRYFRPVFRALPSSRDPRLQAGAAALAAVFRQPDIRYRAERQIEATATLPPGTITIHCPRRTTAEKIANVLLTKSSASGVDEVCKLRDIGSLDRSIFGEHEQAVKAVEHMYASMWRLVVYLAPEHMHRYLEVSDKAGRVIFETVDVHDHFSDMAEISWQNDPHLLSELQAKLGVTRGIPDTDSDELSGFGEIVGRVGDELLESGRLAELPPELFGAVDDLPVPLRSAIEAALLSALGRPADQPAGVTPLTSIEQRTERLIRVFRTHATRPRRKDLDDAKRRYHPALGRLSEDEFISTISALELAVAETKELDNKAVGSPVQHLGWQLDRMSAMLDELLRKHGVEPPERTDKGLFGGRN